MNYKVKNIINIAIVVLIFLAMIIYFMCVESVDNIVNVLKNINVFWMIVGFLLIISYWLLESLSLYIVEKKLYKEQKFLSSLRVNMIGQLFNSLTPFSSGGQPMQVVYMKKEGKKISDSATMMLIKFIVYQAVLVLFSLIIIIFQYRYFVDLVSGFTSLALIGFLVNLTVMFFLILIGAKKNIVKKILSIIYKLLGKIKIMKNADEKIEKVSLSVDNFHEKFKIIKKEKKMIAQMAIVTFFQIVSFFAITYAVYRMFGQNEVSFIKIISAQAFLSMIMAFIPIPGAGIAAEGGFYLIFSTFFAKENINMAILFWRLYTFYLPILVGAGFLIKIRKRDNIDILKEVEEENIEKIE